jgi:hypothetical protein
MPGKFEGEPSYVKLAWELATRGESDDDFPCAYLSGTLVSAFHIKRAEALWFAVVEELGEIPNSYLLVWETTDGLVYHMWCDDARYEELKGESDDA